MKSYLKLLLALLIAVICVMTCVSCGISDESNGMSGTASQGVANAPIEIDPDSVTPALPPVDDWYLDYYHVKFVYRYYSVFINEAKRMELKATDEVLETLYIPLENNGFTDEDLDKIEAIPETTGMTIDGWHLAWNSIARKVEGEAYDFYDGQPITSDITLYLDRGSYAGDSATYTLEADSNDFMTLIISGTGRMFDYEEVDGVNIPWYEQRNKITKVIVEEGITYIGRNAFSGLSKVTELSLPDSLVEIGDSAFQGWKGLTSFSSPKNLETIGVSAFASTGLTFLRLNEGVKTIKESAFNDSNKISTIYIPSTLEYVGTSAFYPGVTNGVMNESYIKNVYSTGTRAQFANVEIGLDNAWFHQLSLLYFVLEEGQDPDENPGPYWRDVNGTPVPYYFMINYYLPSTYGIVTPAFTDYARTEYTVDRKGNFTITATISEENEAFPQSIVYNNYRFGSFTGAVKAGAVISGAAKVTCVTTTKTNNGHLSNNGGIKWQKDGTALTITAVDVATESGVINYLRTAYRNYSITKDTLIFDILGVSSLAEFDVIKSVGFENMDEFMVMAKQLEALDVYRSTDPLIATAAVLKAAGIETADQLNALNKILSELGIVNSGDAEAILALVAATGVDSLDAINELIASGNLPEGVDEEAILDLAADLTAAVILTDITATVTAAKETLAASTLDYYGLVDLASKLDKAGIYGGIEAAFSDLKTKLEGFEASDFNISASQAKYNDRVAAMKKFVALTLEAFAIGDLAAFNAKDYTVGEIAEYIAEGQISEGVFNIWDFATSKDTIAMWGSSIKTVSIRGNVAHVGTYTFTGLSDLETVDLPADVKSIALSAFDGSGNLHTIYYGGSDPSACVVNGAEEGTTLATVQFSGTKAAVYGKTGAATGEDGRYWMELGDDRIAWSLINGTLTIGGPKVMCNFAKAEDAPWYSAKDSITAVAIAAHITSVGANIANGYTSVENISFEGSAIKNIAASSFAGCGMLLDDSNYDWGVLIIDEKYLIAAKTTDSYLEIPFYTTIIAGGAFAQCPNLSELYIPSTIQNIAPDAFATGVPRVIYYDGTSVQWELITANVQFPEGAEYYVALEILEEGDEEKYLECKYDDDEWKYVLVSCIHEWTEWQVITEPTCTKPGLRTHSCNGACGALNVEEVMAPLGHEFSEWSYVEGDPHARWHVCTKEDCDDPNQGYEVHATEGFVNFKEFSAIKDGTEIKVGTSEYFTVILSTFSKVDTAKISVTLGEGEEAVKHDFAGRLYFGQDAVFANAETGTTPKNLIKFTTAGAASVTIWWSHNWNESREMAIFTADGTVVASTAVGSKSWGKGYCSTLEVTEAGEYYIGSTVGHTNAIFQIDVTEGENVYTFNVGSDLEATTTWSSANITEFTITPGTSTACNLKVVEDADGKYLHYERIGTSSSGTSIKFSHNKLTPVNGQSVVFEMYMRQEHLGTSVNSAYIKFFDAKGELRGAPHYWFAGVAGEENGMLSFKASDNSVAYTNFAPEGEWFVLRFVFTAQNKIQIFVKTDITSDDWTQVGEFAAAKAYDIRQIQIQSDASMVHSTDIKSVGFTLIEGVPEVDPEAPDESGRLPDADNTDDKTVDEELSKLPQDTVIFGNLKGGAWNADYTDLVTIVPGTAGVSETRVVRQDGNKYLEYAKLDATAESIISFIKTKETLAGEPVIFQAKIKYNHTSASDAASVIKFVGADSTEYASITLSAATGDALGYVRLNGESIGIKENEWFTITFKMVDGALELSIENYRIKTFDVEGIENTVNITINSAAESLFKLDLDNVYFGGDFVPYEEEINTEHLYAPIGSVVFGNIELGPWASSNTSDVTISIGNSSRATAKVVKDKDGNRYLEYLRTSTSSGTYINMKKTAETAADAPYIFTAKIRHSHNSAAANCSYFRFYNSAGGGDYRPGGALLWFSATPGADAIGNVKIGGIDTGVKENEWFELTFKFSTDTLEILVNGTSITTYTVTGIHNTTQVRLQSDGSMIHRTDFDNVYFGSEDLQYPAVEGEGADIPIGTVLFNDMKLGDWAAEYSTDIKFGIGESSVKIVKGEGTNKYLSYTRNDKLDILTRLRIYKQLETDEGEAVIFSAKMRYNHLSETEQALYIDCIANGAWINTPGNILFMGTPGEAVGDITIKTNYDGKTYAAGVKENEWFDILFKFSGSTMELHINDNLIVTVTDDRLGKVDQLKCEALAGNNMTVDFDDMYFGSAMLQYPTFGEEEEVEQLLPGAVSFDDMELGTWSQSYTTDVDIIPGAAGKSTAEVIKEGDKQFLRYERIKHNSSGTMITFRTTQEIGADQKVAFEARMRNWHLSSSQNCSYIWFKKSGGGKVNTAVCWFSASPGEASNGEWTISHNNNKDKFGLGVNEGEWFDIRIICSSENGGTIEFWTAPAGEEVQLRGKILLEGAGDTRRIEIQSDSNMVHRTDFDNLYFGEFIPDTLTDMPLPKNESDLSSGTVTMTGLKEGMLPYEITYVQGDSESTLGAMMVTRANKVLAFNKAAGSDPYFYLNVTDKNVAANKAVFETQMMFYELQKNGYIDYTLMPAGAAAADRVYKVRVSATEDGKISLANVTLVDGVETVGEAVVTGKTVNAWFTLSIEYTEDDGNFAVYVDKALALTSNAPYSIYKDAAAISKVIVSTDAALEGKIYFENLSLTQVVDVPVV